MKYMIIQEKNLESAIHEVESWLETYAGREYYDGWNVMEEEAKLFSDVGYIMRRDWDSVIKARLYDMDQELLSLKGSEWGCAMAKGRLMRRLGDMLTETFCQDMEWFNLTAGDWSLPLNDDAQVEGMDWYVVPVELV